MVRQTLHTRLMGSDFELTVVEEGTDAADARLREGVEEIQRIERLLTEFSEDSETAALNRHAGEQPVTLTEETHQLIQRCLHLSSLTQGAFDITAGALKSLYRFKEHQGQIPDVATLSAALEKVGSRLVQVLPGNQVFLSQKGMHIGFGAIGKGYAADKVKALWTSRGVKAGVINASGDLTAWGKRPDGRPWQVGIADPNDPGRVLLWLPVENASIATSGNYEQYFDSKGIRYSHNIDPRTGVPVFTMKSVTIISPSAELSDALATAVTVMGLTAGLHFIDQLPDVHAVLIDEHNKIFTSQKIQRHV